jgi:YfiH family protein
MALPKPSGDFEWMQESWGAALRCRPLSEVARHCFTTTELKLAGVRSLGARQEWAAPSPDEDSWDQLARALGVELDELIRLRQVHGATVFDARNKMTAAAAFDEWPEADITMTANPTLAVSVRAADCVPILLADRRSGAVAAVHAGWKGTAAGAARVAVHVLAERYSTDPVDIVAAVGPSIGPCCYEVGRELVPHFNGHDDHAQWFSGDTKLRLNLWRATRDQLMRAGIPGAQIHVCDLCTHDHPSLFPSYRRDGTRAGRLVAAIRSGRGTTL